MIKKMIIDAKTSAKKLSIATSQQKNMILTSISEKLWDYKNKIIEANNKDIEELDLTSISESFIDRMTLNEKRLGSIINDLENVIKLDDPVGEEFDHNELSNGLQIVKRRVPLGLIAVIYESRPNVTVDISGLAIKTGNGVVLRGGKETINTNSVFVEIIKNSLKENNIPESVVSFINDPDRELVNELLKMDKYIDMLIPRGSEKLHRFCLENSFIPVMTGGIGVCHLYVDDDVDIDKAINIIRNSKIQKPSACNALDTVLINTDIAPIFIPKLIDIIKDDQVKLKADKSVIDVLPETYEKYVELANSEDFDQEWLSLVLGLKVVNNIDEAIEHITAHGTAHSDGILTNNSVNSKRFLDEVDSAAVFVNASTRFTDGGQFGLGAEVAISTQKLHARGPMGLKELTSYKWIVKGNYQIRE